MLIIFPSPKVEGVRERGWLKKEKPSLEIVPFCILLKDNFSLSLGESFEGGYVNSIYSELHSLPSFVIPNLFRNFMPMRSVQPLILTFSLGRRNT